MAAALLLSALLMLAIPDTRVVATPAPAHRH